MTEFFIAPGDGPLAGHVLSQAPGYWGAVGLYTDWGMAAPASSGTPSAAATATSTGVNPVETAYSLYGHIVPLSVFGVGRIGGEIISGPWVENGLASFIISFGVPADPSGTRDLREIAFDSEIVWSSNGATGVTTTAGGTFTTEAFTCRFYQGTLSQAADTLESTHFGADAVAYRPQILLAFSNLPLATMKFRKIPYVAAVIGDGTGDDVNLGEAFERLAYSPWVGYTSAQFDTTDITDGLVSGGLIIAQDTQFLQLIQQFGRFYPQWDILQTDKLRIVDRGGVLTADLNLNTDRLMGNIATTRQGQDTVRKDLELSTIDPAADYTIVPSRAQLPRDPVAVTTSVGTDTAYLPAIMDSSTRIAMVTLAKYHEEATRKTISGTAMAYGLEIEPGSLVSIRDLGDNFNNEVFKITETLHGANYVVEFTAAALLRCTLGDDADFGSVVLLLGFGGANASTTFTDESPKLRGNASVFGNTQVSTAQSKFDGSSGLFDGTGDTLNFADSNDFNFGSGQFTIEAWIRPASVVSTFGFIVGQWGNLDIFNPTVDLSWIMYQSDTNLCFNYSITGVDNNFILSGGTLAANTWQHVCVDYDGIRARAYIGGVMVASDTITLSLADCDKALAIGGNSDNAFYFFNGYMDELRLTKGVARYASDSGFTVPTSRFPRS